MTGSRSVILILATLLPAFAQEKPVIKPAEASKFVEQARVPGPPQPLSDADARKVRDLQLRVTGVKLIMAEARRQWEEAQRELDLAEPELRQLFLVLRQKYHCLDCDLDRNLVWITGVPVATSASVPGSKSDEKISKGAVRP